jgi:hypothetical protein
MGFEYQIKVSLPSEQEGKRILLNAPYFEKFDEEYQSAEYRSAESSGVMPSASARVDEGGIYFVEYGSKRVCWEILSYLISTCLAFGKVTIEEL